MELTRQTCRIVKCKKKFRARVNHALCRSCHRSEYGTARPIESRELSENKYRRTRKRRRAVKAVIDKPKGKKK